jgi:hypothetical protein
MELVCTNICSAQFSYAKIWSKALCYAKICYT